MAKRGGKDLTIEYDDAPGGTLTDITAYVDGDVQLKIAQVMEETHAFGDEWDEKTPTGHNQIDDLTISGPYDDASGGPDEVFKRQSGDSDPGGSTRTLKVTWGGTKSTTIETRLMSYQRTGRRGQLSRYEAVVTFTGAPTEA